MHTDNSNGFLRTHISEYGGETPSWIYALMNALLCSSFFILGNKPYRGKHSDKCYTVNSLVDLSLFL